MAAKVYGEVRERDNYRCRLCGIGDRLEVHHIVYRSQGGPDEAWNLITLCQMHHQAAHQREVQPWVLLTMVELGASRPGLSRALAAGDERAKLCVSCDRRTKNMYCNLWEHDVSRNYWCDAWLCRSEDSR